MDAGQVIRRARDSRAWSQASLAVAAGTSRGAVSAYEGGTRSPTVATLNRLLAATGLQLCGELENLRADLDARADEVLAAAPALDLAKLAPLVRSLSEVQHWLSERPGQPEELDERSGTLGWAFDGATALLLQGLAFPTDFPEVVLVLDGAARSWLFRQLVRPFDGGSVSAFDSDLATLQLVLSGVAIGRPGMLRLRLVAELPPVIQVSAGGDGPSLPAMRLDAVEVQRPELGEVLARLRERGGRT